MTEFVLTEDANGNLRAVHEGTIPSVTPRSAKLRSDLPVTGGFDAPNTYSTCGELSADAATLRLLSVVRPAE